MQMETKQIALQQTEIKFNGAAFAFSGYASMFGGVDSYGDTIEPGAYKSTLENRDRPVRMRWNHYGDVIGKWLKIQEDEKGLYVEGELTPGHSKATDVFASLKHGAIDGLSIGYRVKAFNQIDNDRRLLKEIDLIEISVVEEPADLAARIGEVKSALETANSLKEVESLLRDVGGFSRVDAKHLVSKINSLYQREAEAEKEKQDIAKLFKKHGIFMPKL
jgi:HK97 family phage prohead protease